MRLPRGDISKREISEHLKDCPGLSVEGWRQSEDERANKSLCQCVFVSLYVFVSLCLYLCFCLWIVRLLGCNNSHAHLAQCWLHALYRREETKVLERHSKVSNDPIHLTDHTPELRKHPSLDSRSTRLQVV